MKTISQASVSSEQALALLQQAESTAAQMNLRVAVCVVDIHGRVKAKWVKDGCPLIADDLVERKARTALLGMASEDFAQALASAADVRASMLQLPHISLLGGAYPLLHEGEVVGAFAVAGATVDEDMAMAKAILAAM
jgi:uncharacterized protein GlcG (DUF336 family)